MGRSARGDEYKQLTPGTGSARKGATEQKSKMKYVVMKMYRSIEPSIVFMCDDLQDAKDYARIMSHKDAETAYGWGALDVLGRIGGPDNE